LRQLIEPAELTSMRSRRAFGAQAVCGRRWRAVLDRFLRWPPLHTLRSASSKFARCHRWAVQGFTSICPLELREIRANTAKCASKPGWSPSHAQILGHTGGPPQSGAPKPQDAPLRSSSSGPPRQVCLRPPCALGFDGCFNADAAHRRRGKPSDPKMEGDRAGLSARRSAPAGSCRAHEDSSEEATARDAGLLPVAKLPRIPFQAGALLARPQERARTMAGP